MKKWSSRASHCISAASGFADNAANDLADAAMALLRPEEDRGKPRALGCASGGEPKEVGVVGQQDAAVAQSLDQHVGVIRPHSLTLLDSKTNDE